MALKNELLYSYFLVHDKFICETLKAQFHKEKAMGFLSQLEDIREIGNLSDEDCFETDPETIFSKK